MEQLKESENVRCDLRPEDNALLRWRKRNAYYYRWLESIYRFVIRPNSRVLHVGCQYGDLLDAVKPARGLGLDSDEKAIELAQRRFPELEFRLMDPHKLDINEKFDYVIICNSLGIWNDVQQVFERIRTVTGQDTRIVVAYYNYLWEWIMWAGSKLHIRRPQPYQNWLPPGDIENLLDLAGFDVIRSDSFLMLPKRLPPLTILCNYFLSPLPGFRLLNLVNLVVARPLPSVRRDEDIFVSVIVPCRNEKGNIEDVVKKTPLMGRDTEIVFVDGNSTDGTVEEIQRQILAHPQRKITLINQGGAKGKADAARKGFAAAKGDFLVILDADLTVKPQDLPKFFRALRDGKGEFINGSRLVYPMQKQAMRFLNLLGNKFFGMLFTWLLGQRFRDTLCGTKMISRKNYELIAANRSYFGDFDPFGDFELIFGAVKENLKVVEIPVAYQARTYGRTNISRFKHGWLLLKISWIAFKKIKWCGGRHLSSV